MNKGHKIVYYSKHRSTEQGKDIFAIDEQGNYHAYQLKGGDIGPNEYRSIRGEIDELIRNSLIKPGIDRTKPWASYLVTNGRISDEVRTLVYQENEDNKLQNRNYSPLHLIERDELLSYFIEAQSAILPQEFSEDKGLYEFQKLLQLLLSDGCDLLNKELLFDFIKGTFTKNLKGRKSNPSNVIGSSIILFAYLLKPFQLANNYFAMFEAWTMLAAYIVYHCENKRFPFKKWKDSYNLVFCEILFNLKMLKREALERENFLEGDHFGDGGLLYKTRVALLMGVLCTYEIYCQQAEEGYKTEPEFLSLLKKTLDEKLIIWGEGSFSYFLPVIQFLELNGEIELAKVVFDDLIACLIGAMTVKRKYVLPPPYISPLQVLNKHYFDEELDYQADIPTSYILKSLLVLAAKRNYKSILQAHWRMLTHLRCMAFKFEDDTDYFLLKTEKGGNVSEEIRQSESWSNLKSELLSGLEVPDILEKNEHLVRFVTLVYPHRINHHVTALLDVRITG